jgi:hypothetical protein
VQSRKDFRRRPDPQIVAIKDQDGVVSAIEARIKWRWLEAEIQEEEVHHLEPKESTLFSSIQSTPQLQDLTWEKTLPFWGIGEDVMVNVCLKKGLRDIILANMIALFDTDNVEETNRLRPNRRGIRVRVRRRRLPRPIEDQTNSMFTRELKVVYIEKESYVRALVRRVSLAHFIPRPIAIEGAVLPKTQPLQITPSFPSGGLRG